MLNRRTFIKQTFTNIAVFSSMNIPSKLTRASESPPNVLFIIADDTNDWIGCMEGHPDVITPNFDRLANRGILFNRAYSSGAICNPSRTSLLTGIRPTTSGVYNNKHADWRNYLPNAITIPHNFKNNGYYARGIGKVFHDQSSHEIGVINRDEQNWNEYDGGGLGNPKPDQIPACGIEDLDLDWAPIDKPDEEFPDSNRCKLVCDFLNTAQVDKPFFLACGLTRTHAPLYVPKKYKDLYPPDEITLPAICENDLEDLPTGAQMFLKGPCETFTKVFENNKWGDLVSAYLASITYNDSLIGKILDTLDASPFANNTIIVYTSDHGFHMGEKLRIHKNCLWEEATHVPLIVSIPDSIHKGVICERTVSHLDIYPTLAELCGLDTLPEFEGVSLVPLLNDPTAKWDRPALTSCQYKNESVRSERWRYIRYKDGTEELYDHDNDPNEWTNLADQPEYTEVKQELSTWLPTYYAPFTKPDTNVSSWPIHK